ncbi:threonine--tRNA ligase [Pseudoalteromonas luteoviolacea]|nr:threonine--tRNA ligase [Pseudoalteromonas luteoviolacea]
MLSSCHTFKLTKSETQMINEHRKIGKQLQLFDMSSSASGMVDWYPQGYKLYRRIQSYIRTMQLKYGYHEVNSPVLANHDIWHTSGHSDKYQQNMFHLHEHNLAVRPMSCPFHINIFNSLVKSYKQLPYRIAEFGLCHRNEASGSLNGLFRLRAFNQDDGHIFCRKGQIKNELKQFCNMLFEMYAHFGFQKEKIKIKISLRPDNKIGTDALWDELEQYLKTGLDELELSYQLVPGDGAFYGAKVEFALEDSLNREWQCGTFQLDFFLAEKFGCTYLNESADPEHPVILHRAVLGSIERFIAILLEHYNGRLPIEFNPNAIILLPISQQHLDYCYSLHNKLISMGITCNIDGSDNSISYRVRASYKQKCNYCIVIGDQEQNNNMLTLKDKKAAYSVHLNDLTLFLLHQKAH